MMKSGRRAKENTGSSPERSGSCLQSVERLPHGMVSHSLYGMRATEKLEGFGGRSKKICTMTDLSGER